MRQSVFGLRPRNIRVSLLTLDPLEAGVDLPGPVRECLRGVLAEMLAAWERVKGTDDARMYLACFSLWDKWNLKR